MIKTIVLCLALSISSIGFTQSTREFGEILENRFSLQWHSQPCGASKYCPGAIAQCLNKPLPATTLSLLVF